MRVVRLSRLCAIVALVAAPASCRPAFQPNRMRDNRALFDASVREFQRRRWDNAIAGFDLLTQNLPARDPLLAPTFFYLGRAHDAKKDYLLAAQGYTRLAESFPDDSLADDALLHAARAYAQLWKRPSLDAQYGETALNTLNTLIAIYPNSPLRAEAQREMARLEQWLATKMYENGMHYFRRKAYDSAIIYFRDIVRLYPDIPRARDAQLRLVQAYRAIRYNEDAQETCAALRQKYPGDREMREVCGDAPQAVSAPTP